MLRFLATLALSAGLHAQTWQISLPASISSGDLVTLRVTLDGAPQAGVALRVTAPASEIATVKGLRLLALDAKTTLFKDDVVLVAGSDGNECRVIAASASAMVVPCDGLDRRQFGQPLGTTDADGRVLSRDLAAVPVTLELAAERAGMTLATATVEVKHYQFDETTPISPGVSFRGRRWVANGEGPFSMQVIEIDPKLPQTFLLPVRATDRAIGLETASNLSRRYGALAAINGTAFLAEGAYAGAAKGPYVWNGRVAASGTAAQALLVCADRRVAIEGVAITGRVVAADGQSHDLAGINRPRGEGEAILYTPLLGDRTLTGDEGAEAQLDLQDRVNELRDRAGNSAIPFDGRVVSGSGAGADFLREKAASAGSLLRVEATVPSAVGACVPTDIVPAAESNPDERRPRAAFALTDRGTWLLATADGWQSSTAGMRQDEFDRELAALGATRVVALEGGAAATLTLNDAVRNSPAGGEAQAVGDALMVFQVNDLLGLLQVLDRIASEPGQVSQAGLDALNPLLDQAVDALVDGDPGGVRQAALMVRDTIKKLDGNEIAVAAGRVMLRASEAFITTLPDVQPLRKRAAAGR